MRVTSSSSIYYKARRSRYSTLWHVTDGAFEKDERMYFEAAAPDTGDVRTHNFDRVKTDTMRINASKSCSALAIIAALQLCFIPQLLTKVLRFFAKAMEFISLAGISVTVFMDLAGKPLAGLTPASEAVKIIGSIAVLLGVVYLFTNILAPLLKKISAENGEKTENQRSCSSWIYNNFGLCDSHVGDDKRYESPRKNAPLCISCLGRVYSRRPSCLLQCSSHRVGFTAVGDQIHRGSMCSSDRGIQLPGYGIKLS